MVYNIEYGNNLESKLIHAGSGRLLQIKNRNRSNNSRIKLGSDYRGKNQRWELQQKHNKLAWNYIRNAQSGLCLTTLHGRLNKGTPVVQSKF